MPAPQGGNPAQFAAYSQTPGSVFPPTTVQGVQRVIIPDFVCSSS